MDIDDFLDGFSPPRRARPKLDCPQMSFERPLAESRSRLAVVWLLYACQKRARCVQILSNCLRIVS